MRDSSDLIEEMVRRIVTAVDPQQVILFGSYAHGTPHDDSDVDILVVMASTLPRYKRSVPIFQALTGILIPKDIVVYTPEEIDAWSDVPEAFITNAVSTGRILYEKDEERSGQRVAREGAA